MNQIPQEIIDKVLDAANIIEVIGEDITRKKQGVNYIGVCLSTTTRLLLWSSLRQRVSTSVLPVVQVVMCSSS